MRTKGGFPLLLLICCISINTIHAQELYLPADIRKAVREADNKRIILTVNNRKAVMPALIDSGVFLDANPANSSYPTQ